MARQASRKLAAASKLRSSTPMRSPIKQSSSHSRRRHLKQEYYKRERMRLALTVQKARHEFLAQAARETQRIVLGDGKYVEEKFDSASVSYNIPAAHISSPLGHASSQGIHSHPKAHHTMSTTHVMHDISSQIILSKQGTMFYPHCLPSLADWRKSPTVSPIRTKPISCISFVACSMLTAARKLHERRPDLTLTSPYTLTTTSVGILSFASPKRPGGGYLHGGNEQEETLARSSSLVANLQTDPGKEFYTTHRKFLSVDGAGIYDHSMVYSPGVVAFRQDDSCDTSPFTATNASLQFIPPYFINVLSAVPVNAAAIRQNYSITPSDAHIFEDGIRDKMRDRMARALRIFESRGDRVLVLGAFGCGSSANRVDMVAEIWAGLLVCGEGEEKASDGKTPVKRVAFKDSFEEVVFAIPGKLFEPFKKAFELRAFEVEVSQAASE